MKFRPLLLVLLVFALRLPFLHQAIQGDDPYYLYGAEHAQIDPLHPTHAKFIFQGDLVDMRGHTHGPLDSWILAAPLAVLGAVREAPFHAVYIVFSLIAVLAMWSLAKKFCDQPFIACLLFLAVPAFVVNGNSFEADLPFLAFWLAAVALFVRAVDSSSGGFLALSATFAALAALDAYQAILLTPILAVYLFEKRRTWVIAWAALFAAPVAILVWQLFERLSSGALPASMLTSYMKTYGLQDLANKAHSGGALIAHAGWIVSPLIVIAAFFRNKAAVVVAIVAAAGAAFYDVNPLFWLSIGCGVLAIGSCIGRDFLKAWVLMFFAAALVLAYAGSARYLLPIAAPIAILVVRKCSRAVLIAGFALQMALSLGLAIVNYEHWDAYRQFAASLAKQASEHRVWINGEWGLRWYLEQEGAIAMAKEQTIPPGDMVVSSELAYPLPVHAQFAPVSQMEIRPSIPLRLISLDGRSAYSAASAKGLLPFEISKAPIDRVRAEIAVDRKPALIWIKPGDPEAAAQIVTGLSADGWMSKSATVLLKRPDHALPLRVEFIIHQMAPARRMQMFVDGQLMGEQTVGGPGPYAIAVPMNAGVGAITVTLTVDATFSVPGDGRELGVIVTGIGFR